MYIFGGKRITNLENIIEKIIKTISGHTHSIIGRGSVNFQLANSTIKKVFGILYVLGI